MPASAAAGSASAGPGAEAAGQIDLGSVMGIGFPPFRGGIIRYAQTLGANCVLVKLLDLEKRFGERFAPCDGIRKRGETGGSFYEKV